MNRQRGQVSSIAVVLLIVGLVVGAGGGYFAASSAFEQKIKDCDATTNAMAQVIQTYESRVAGLETEITGCESQVADLETDVSNLETAKADLESNVASLQAEVDGLQLQLEESASEYLVSDTHIEVEKLQKFTIILESNPTTGFQWQIANPLDESVVKFVDSEFKTLAIEFPPPVGGGGVEIWTFEAIAAGSTEIVMEYVRPWESVPPIREQTFTVIVE